MIRGCVANFVVKDGYSDGQPSLFVFAHGDARGHQHKGGGIKSYLYVMIGEGEKAIGVDEVAQAICIANTRVCRNKKNSITAQYLCGILSE